MSQHKISAFKKCLPLFTLLCLFIAGCGTHSANVADPLRMSKDNPTDMSALRQMADDAGVPLSDTELRVLASTGELDRNLSPSEMNDVVVQYKYFLRKFRPSMEKYVQRSEAYLAHSKKVFRDRNMPEELAYLAIVESGYNPQATSPSGAAGTWQFMPPTGKRYGLEQSWWVDERRDPYKSAASAADYLKKLYGDFHDWHLAIAAYNAGEGKIGRALDGTGTKSFSDLKLKNHTLDERAKLKDETKQYVPRFIAVCKIMRNLDQLGFTKINPEGVPAKAAITVPPGTDLLALSQGSDLNWGEFSAHNPSFKRYVSSPARESVVYLPKSQEQAALNFLRRPEARSASGWQTYSAGPKDDWNKISKKYNVPPDVLREANNQKKLVAGTTVRIPTSNGRADFVPATYTASAQSSASAPAQVIAAIKNGTIATKAENNVNKNNQVATRPDPVAVASREVPKGVTKLASAKTETYTEVKAGPSGSLGGGKAAASPSGKNNVHVIKPGDTYWSVARKYDKNPKDLIRMNQNNTQALRPGSTMFIAED